MEHQVFVPVPVPALRRTLGDPVRVARCVPGLQQDADGSASPLAGRLKFRAGGHTITYRGELKLSGPGAAEGDRFTVTGEGAEARGTGAVKLALTVSLTAADGGTTLTYGGTASGDGRLAELEEGAALTAAQRLLDRFTQQLVTETLAAGEGEDAAPGSAEDVSAERLAGDVEPSADGRDGEGAGAGAGTGSAAEPAEPGSAAGTGAAGASEPAGTGESGESAGAVGVPEPGKPAESAAAAEATSTPEGADLPGSAEPGSAAGSPEPGSDAGTGAAAGASESSSVFDSPVPPPSLDPVAGVEFTVPDEPPAEAAHARRTMIGRSAEEVDHAPPRGRYAPVPSPDSGGAGTTLRWVAPAAALALASAVVLSRALRRRR
ncbi:MULTISPECIES: SRPBCC domain-containing protein [unclassified Streptomyces]|uniref:SRPBCC domain-containing protein n=1 Tax=unclassified Streptomyces TaxID=2593676 RepID=UPI000823AFF0|nr:MULTISPECIES: SRPBCC domain-containing protein [unclassified Streptomyces]SCK62182.1 Carbon monoxide dehydrogenase subunit G [Streptomyces sp. AmelKG-D3]